MAQNQAMDAALLTLAEMGEADRLTIAAGTPGIVLMERAAEAIAETVLARYPGAERVACLAGPGNNGGDAYAAAAILLRAGREVRLFHLVPPEKLQGDAANAAAAYDGPAEPLAAFDAQSFDLVIDGLFGAGLARPLEGEVAELVERLNAAATPVVAIDLPSGISGASGAVLGTAVEAEATVTFFRRKPGHLLEPGRSHCGAVAVSDIGVLSTALETIAPKCFENRPALWRHRLAVPSDAGHKYDRGHAVVFSGPASRTGAARLAATAALRAGAGLVTMFSPAGAVLVNAAHLTAVMLKRCEDTDELASHLGDTRLNAFVLGPGFGAGETARAYAEAVLAAGGRLVLDADGISSFKDDPEALFAAARAASEARGDSEPALVLTPHSGEFKRLFPDIASAEGLSKLDQARLAAERACAVVVLKGRDTVIAAPDGRAAINATGTPWLATAGSGDVLSGIVAAQLAQGTPSFEAAAAAVWMHGKAAEAFGAGLIAEDLPGMLPKVFAGLEATGP
ncbi:NAD(P)H-hydrate dehydratase [Jiella endophytica]|uniref:Bifunctional NAD(P)H-hydrate repair enzyme n=2 Tax=Jiella endophytica TaxID=2558362 RepID=A0A4Y8RRY9_9HYPH|nr:NAD(P)H-hydrate dehydratase [Jiella endophytica]TFF27065.1 NAD(P)H-hydrate dehydratase [Jiella endophytica]